jgi:hypothetical protein
MANHVGPYERRLVQQWLLELDASIKDQCEEFDRLAEEAESRGFAEAAKNFRNAVALRRESVQKLKEFYLG